MRLRWDRFQILALASAIGAFALTVAGGVVTQTESGTGCPDWPLCNGQIVPDFSIPAVGVEWTHRTIAAVEGVLVLITTIFAWRDRRRERRILFTSVASLILVIVQAGLGAAVVFTATENKPLVVLHLSVAAAFFAFAVVTAVLAFVLPKPSIGDLGAEPSNPAAGPEGNP